MPYRLTKEELDVQFEQFLKESVSDDSLDFGSPDNQPRATSSHKPAPSWWQDDSSGETGRAETAKRRFLKTKKSQPENNKDICQQPFYKPVPKPRCKAPDKLHQSDETHKDTVGEVSQTVETLRAPSADSDSLSSHENLQCESGKRSPDETNETPSASTDGHSQREDGLLGSGKNFMKSLRKSQPIREEEDEDPGDAGLKEEGLEAALLTRDSTETDDSVKAPAGNVTSMGLDTLEEEEDKARFFAQLEAGASSTIDYSKLNIELDSTSSTMTPNLRKAEESVELSNADQSKARDPESIRESPVLPGCLRYSEDFENKEKMKEPLEEKSEMSPILAKVSLYDSLDDTGGEDGRKDTAGSLDRGQSYVQSGGSEMEALPEAYRQIHFVEVSDDHNLYDLSVEATGGINRSSSPSSPQRARQSLKPASTNKSDLPTAEELMRPIQPEQDQIRGFTLQPVSAVELDKKTTPGSLESTFIDYTQSNLKRPGNAGPAAGIRGAKGLTSRPSSSPDALNHDLTWSIREEVERLMQDQDKSSSRTSTHTGKSKGQPTSRGSTSAERKPAVRGRRGKAVATSRLSGTDRATATATAQPSVSHLQQHPQRAKSTKSQAKEDCAGPGLKESNELVASVQSLVAVLQQQIDTSSHHNAAREVSDLQVTRLIQHLPQINRAEESCVVEELRVQLAQKEEELQRMKRGTEELNSLRQQNYLLQSKLRNAEDMGQKRWWMEATKPATEEKLQQIDREIKEQETLIKGYQQENEKLYLQMKAQQVRSKANEEAMFNENQRLLKELAVTREQLNKTSKSVGTVCIMDHTQRITDPQINTLQRNEAQLCDDINRQKQETHSVEVDLQLMKKNRDLAKAQAICTSGDQSLEMRVLEEQHREEVVDLKKKLQWYADNQELLDRDAVRLKAATAEILQLKEQVKTLKHDVGRRSSEQQRKARDTSADTKRIRDLEHQVKELEQILRSRNPNSLPALIYAASAANPEDVDQVSPPSRINTLLERRIQRLEAELESHDEEAKRSLRTMEQHFHRIKLRYEQQISELEQQLEVKGQVEAAAAGSEPWTSKVQTVEEELQRVKENHQEKEKSLHNQIESLQQQLKHKVQPSPSRHQRQAEAAFGVRIDRLNQELATKTRAIQELSRTVDRLQKERRNMLSVPIPRTETRSTETKPLGPNKTLSPAAGETATGEESFPAAQYEKTYQPTVFTGCHISEVLQENEALKQRVELLQLHSEEEALEADAVQAREELCRLREQSAEQLASIKAEHLQVLDHLQATHALEHSSSKVAQLASQLSTQEIVIKHLQEQLREQRKAEEALTVSQSREDALQKQLTRLLQELKEAKEAQSPEVKLLCNLERKLLSMELRHQYRERELQQVIGGAWQTSAADQRSDVERWKRLAQDKSRELEAFRLELDSILDILRHLQRQGVVLPQS